ncbi:hypothetical protein D3C79_624660 [compost metagenome]
MHTEHRRPGEHCIGHGVQRTDLCHHAGAEDTEDHPAQYTAENQPIADPVALAERPGGSGQHHPAGAQQAQGDAQQLGPAQALPEAQVGDDRHDGRIGRNDQ